MKKLFLIMMIAFSATAVVVSCKSKDDDNGPVVTKITLELKPDTKSVPVGTQITFTVRDQDGKDVTSQATITAGTAKVDGGVYQFNTAGSIPVKAVVGDQSVSVVIAVFKPVTSIVLSSDAGSSYGYGQLVTFTVKGDNGDDVTENSTFKVNGTAIAGSTYVLKAGSQSVVATYEKDGKTFTSNTLTFTGLTEPTFANYFTYDGVKFETNASVYVYFGATEPIEGKVYDQWLLVVNKVVSNSGNYEFPNEMAIYVYYPRTNPAVKVYPSNGDASVLNLPYSPLYSYGVANTIDITKTFGYSIKGAGFTLANFNPQTVGDVEESGDTTKFSYTLVFDDGSKDGKILTGVHTGKVGIFDESEQPAAKKGIKVLNKRYTNVLNKTNSKASPKKRIGLN